MEKIIGNKNGLLFYALVACSLGLNALGMAAASPSITLSLRSMDGTEIEQVAVGEPFRVEVVLEGMGQGLNAIEVPGLEKINGRRNGYYLTTINGVSTVRFNYQAQVDKPMMAFLGPVVVDHEGKEIRSNKLKVVARMDATPTHGARPSRKKDQDDTFLRFYVDKKDAVVGEKITARLRFYYGSPELQLRKLNIRDLPSFSVTAVEGPTSGQEVIDGKTYRYAEWRWYLYPKESGKLVIPAYSIDFDVVNQRSSQWSFFSFFGNQLESKRVHSNAQIITVKPLPNHKGPVFLVGRLTDAVAELSPDTTKVGDAALLAIEIEGEGNIEGIENLTLVGIPDALKYYDSKNVLVNGQPKTGRFMRKRFEFVIQGMQAGTWEIPAQTFTYYDVEQKAYLEKSINPLTLTVLPGPPVDLQEKSEQVNGASEQEIPLVELGPLNTKGPWNVWHQRAGLPWWLFVLIALLPFGLIGAAVAGNWLSAWYRPRARYKSAFKRAHEQLVTAQSARDSRRIYTIMKAVIADRMQVPVDQISPEYIHNVLHNAGMHQERLEEWDAFSGVLMEQLFAYHDYKPELFAIAHQWLNEWEGLL